MSEPPRDDFKRFEQFAKKLVAVPKKEVDRKRALYDAKRKRKPGRRRG